MRSFLPRSSSAKEQKNEEGSSGGRTHLYLNVYDLSPINNYLYWFGFGIFHSGIEGVVFFLVGKAVLVIIDAIFISFSC